MVSLSPREAEVYGHIRRSSGGLTCAEVETRANLPHTTVSARIRGLVLKGVVADSGQRAPGPTGVPQTVWERARKGHKPPQLDPEKVDLDAVLDRAHRAVERGVGLRLTAAELLAITRESDA